MKQKTGLSSGFTLLEVMVAVTIFGVALVTILHLLATSLNNTLTNRNYTIGLLIAQSKMAEAINQINTEEAKGFDPGKVQYQWAVEIEPAETDGMEKIKVRVQWQEKRKPKKIELVSLHLKGEEGKGE